MTTRRSRGLTLIEIMVVVSIMAMLMAAAVVSTRSIGRSGLRGSATQLAACIRYCYDRAVTTNAYYRIVLDFDRNSFWAERSDDRMLLTRDKEAAPGKGQAFDQEAADKARDEKNQAQLDRIKEHANSLGINLEPPPSSRRAKFETFTDAAAKQVQLKGGVQLFDAYTPRQKEPYKKGRAYLYFFPDGHTERALVRLSKGDDFFSLLVSPLTGAVEVVAQRLDPSRDFDTIGQEKGNR
jgi:general secretion pathway protein H